MTFQKIYHIGNYIKLKVFFIAAMNSDWINMLKSPTTNEE